MDIEDMTQETLLRVYKNLEDFRGEETYLGTWVFQIAANVYRNALRARTAHKRSGDEVSLDGAESEIRLEPTSEGLREWRESQPLDKVLVLERQQLVHRAIEGLPPQMRWCVLLRVDRDLKYREIATLLRISIETVKAHLFQARQRLRDELGDYFQNLEL